MNIPIISPNTTGCMTRKIAVAARAVARPGTEIFARNSQSGPASIQGFPGVVTCEPCLLE